MSTITILPNPSLKGGEIHLAAFSSAKQALYAEARRRHSEGWFQSEITREADYRRRMQEYVHWHHILRIAR